MVIETSASVTSEVTVNMFHVSDCCRVCLKIDYSLIEITSLDHDMTKFSDKLTACVAEVIWLKEGSPSLICSNCIERLRVAYDFRSVCLQSDQTLLRHSSQIQDEIKLEVPQVTGPLEVEAKFEFTSTQVVPDTSQCLKEEPPNSPQKHLLEDDDCLENFMHVIEADKFRKCDSEPQKCTNFIDQKPESTKITQMIQLDQQQLPYLQDELQLQIQQQSLQQKQVVMRTTLDDTQSKIYSCTVCSKTYQRNDTLKRHMRIHTGENRLECKHCKKQFFSLSNLKRHLETLTGEKPFSCAICKKGFTSKSEVTIHMKRHTGEKPYACTYCNYRCLTATNLKLHKRRHTGEKPCSCDTCGRKFSTLGSLKRHIRIHTGVRPFTCNICEKTFSRPAYLSKHMTKHTGEEVSCKTCDAKFTHSSQLNTHARKHTEKHSPL